MLCTSTALRINIVRFARSVLVVLEGGRPSGIAYVEFPTPQEATGVRGVDCP